MSIIQTVNEPITVLPIFWEGPIAMDKVITKNEPWDFGVYQIYGTHNVLGPNTLLYIGQASDQKFARRLPQERKASVNRGR